MSAGISGIRMVIIAVAISSSTILASGLAAPPVSALSAYDIQIPEVVKAQAQMPVKITNLYDAKSCTIAVRGATPTKAVVAKVHSGAVTVRLRLPAGPPGRYTIRATCGRDGTATSRPFTLVAKSSPLQASCDVIEYGFSMRGSESPQVKATFGAVVANSSPELTAQSVELALTFRDAGGNVVATDTVTVRDIAPGARVYVGDSYVETAPATSLSVLSSCKTSTTAVEAGVVGTGGVQLDSDGDPIMQGQFVNPMPFTLDKYSAVAVVLRNASGQLIGGTSTNLDAFVPAGGVGTWNADIYYMGLTSPPTVASMLFPREKD